MHESWAGYQREEEAKANLYMADKEEKLKSLGKGVVKRNKRRTLGLFIDGTGLDRAARRMNRKIDMPKFIRGVTSGLTPAAARYYTLIPNEDDSRQRSFLDAIRRAGLQVIVKRLPPKGITRQVSVDLEMAADIVAFSLGHSRFSSLGEYQSENHSEPHQTKKTIPMIPRGASLSAIEQSHDVSRDDDAELSTGNSQAEAPNSDDSNVQRVITVVCPSRELAYPISLANELGVDTVTADFGQFNNKDILKSAAKWIDLSDSETIWRDSK